MAIDKIGSKALTDSSVVAADIAPGTVTTTQLAGSITNAKLSNSTVTVNGTSIALGASGSIPAVSWQSVVVSDGSTVTTMVAGNGYFVNNTSAAGLVKLPTSASAGDTVAIKDYAGNFGTNSLTIQRNGHNIQGVANDSLISTNRASLTLVYVDATKGWLYAVESNVADLENKFYVTATGGTVTTSSDFKIHTFTGDGCFVVSCAGNSFGSDTVDYLVVAGGGGAGGDGGGGGGAGGFRVSNSYGLPAPTMSPLSNPTGINASAQTYPITVGGGGASPGTGDNPGASISNGSNSIFSTITSAGGGAGGGYKGGTGNGDGSDGGSGGGSSKHIGNSLATNGNTPPVSPPQGNNGGSGNATTGSSGGGGGAGEVGENGYGPLSIGDGGDGSYVSPSFAVSCAGTPGPVGSVRYFSGGGGGGGDSNFPNAGGAGGGGAGVNNPSPGSPGTAGSGNTGGGGGAGGNAAPGVSGGSGIVILRYKFQN